jgi:hypothetical protein
MLNLLKLVQDAILDLEMPVAYQLTRPETPRDQDHPEVLRLGWLKKEGAVERS